MPHGTMRSNRGQVGVAVEREAVHRHPALDPHADGRHLAFGATVVRGQPDAGCARPRARRRTGPCPAITAISASSRRRTYSTTSMGVASAHEGIADELARAVPGDEAAAVDVDDRGAVGGPVRRAGALAGGVDGRVLQEHEHVRAGAVAAGGCVGPLGVPGGAVLDEAELLDVQRCGGGPAGPCAVVPHADHATPYRNAQHAYRNADLVTRRTVCPNAGLAPTPAPRSSRVGARESCVCVRDFCVRARDFRARAQRRPRSGAEVGEGGLGCAAAAHQGALLRRGVAVVAGHEQAVAERDVAAQRARRGEGGQRARDLGDVQVDPPVGRDPVDPGQLAADVALGEPVGRPEKGRRHECRPSGE